MKKTLQARKRRKPGFESANFNQTLILTQLIWLIRHE